MFVEDFDRNAASLHAIVEPVHVMRKSMECSNPSSSRNVTSPLLGGGAKASGSRAVPLSLSALFTTA